MEIVLNDCKREMKWMKEDSIDSIVCDPPYELGFMGKKWDASGIAYDVEVWKEALRVLKPGGHLLAFGGTRTHHRLMAAIEDAGFEIRDCLMCVYGSGFPKSHNISKAIDKKAGAKRKVIAMGRSGKSETHTSSYNMSKGGTQIMGGDYEITEAKTEDAIKWEGWGTALKPAYEPIVLARKPLSEKTIANNVLTHGTGGINIDDCRISFSDKEDIDSYEFNNNGDSRKTKKEGDSAEIHDGGWKVQKKKRETPSGRFPANVILDEVAGQILDGHNDTGGASRFFYCPKASKKERNEGVEGNTHPTVKPIKLMEYLVKLITPPNGTVLDPFMGSGSTGCACVNLGFDFYGIELEEPSYDIAKARIDHYQTQTLNII